MSVDFDDQIRVELTRSAADVEATQAWKAETIDKLMATRPASQRRRTVLLAAAAALVVLAVVVGLTRLGAGQPTPPSGKPDLPSRGANATVLDALPDGFPPAVDYVDAENVLHRADGTTLQLSASDTVLGEISGGLVVDGGDGIQVVHADGSRVALPGTANSLVFTHNTLAAAVWIDGRVYDGGADVDGIPWPIPQSIGRDAHIDIWTNRGAVVSSMSGFHLIPVGGADPISLQWGPLMAADTSRVVLTNDGGCFVIADMSHTGVYRLAGPDKTGQVVGPDDPVTDPNGPLCTSVVHSISPDGSTVLLGTPGFFGGPTGATVTGLLDIDSGRLTPLSDVAALDEFGDAATPENGYAGDLIDFSWEDRSTILLAYLTEQDTDADGNGSLRARFVRCSVGQTYCLVAPGDFESSRDSLVFTAGRDR